jgi:hypothetical protein
MSIACMTRLFSLFEDEQTDKCGVVVVHVIVVIFPVFRVLILVLFSRFELVLFVILC